MSTNRLTKWQHQQWVEDGYLHLKNIIPREEATAYLDAANEVIDPYEKEKPRICEKGYYTITQILENPWVSSSNILIHWKLIRLSLRSSIFFWGIFIKTQHICN